MLEDDPYGMLRFEGDRLPKLLELDGGQFVIYAGTFSKILSPGVRLGWAIAPRPLLAKLNVGAQAATLCPSSFAQLFVSAYLETGHWEGYVAGLRDLYRERRDVMLEALAAAAARRGDVDAARRRAVRVGDAAGLHRHDGPAGARARRTTSRSSPAAPPTWTAAAGSSMRLNFSGLQRRGHPRGRAADRRDRPRAGRPLRHAHRGAPRRRPRADEPQPRTDLADVLALPRRRDDGDARRETR